MLDLDERRLKLKVMFGATIIMPPFGQHRKLTEEEIDKAVEYICSL